MWSQRFPTCCTPIPCPSSSHRSRAVPSKVSSAIRSLRTPCTFTSLMFQTTTVTLDMGSAAGFDVGTQFTAIEAVPGGQKTVIEVQHIDEPLASTAQVVGGPASVKVGQIIRAHEDDVSAGGTTGHLRSQAGASPVRRRVRDEGAVSRPYLVGRPHRQPIDFLVWMVNRDGLPIIKRPRRCTGKHIERRGVSLARTAPVSEDGDRTECSLPAERIQLHPKAQLRPITSWRRG